MTANQCRVTANPHALSFHPGLKLRLSTMNEWTIKSKESCTKRIHVALRVLMTFAGCVSVQVLLLVDTWYGNKACQFVLRKIRFIFPHGNLHRYGSTYGFITFSSDLSIPDIQGRWTVFLPYTSPGAWFSPYSLTLIYSVTWFYNNAVLKFGSLK
jgi:hypothetical protein